MGSFRRDLVCTSDYLCYRLSVMKENRIASDERAALTVA